MNFANRARIANRISNRAPFEHGNMSGTLDNYESAGRLSGETRAEFSADMSRAIAEGSTAYVVKSYGTPIAWYVPLTGWSIPDVKHSPTTTHHQHVARMGAYA
jgi:hypothetical protein